MGQSTTSKGACFFLAHQFTPAALRYPSPLVGLGIPYVLGPHGGSVTTPKGFLSECQGAAWYTKLRNIDQWRLKYDPILKRSFAQAEAVIGVGDYVKDLLQHCNVKRFILHGELTADDLAPLAKHSVPAVGKLKLLHVGRAIRTKGLRDLIRALALLKEYPNITLVSAGNGEDLTRTLLPSVLQKELLFMVKSVEMKSGVFQGVHRDFKNYYLGYVKAFYRKDFPDLLSYTRFLEVMPRTIVPMCAYFSSLKGKSTGIEFIDSTSLKVCHNIRISRHKTFDGIAQRGKGTMGWFYGFKLHIFIEKWRKCPIGIMLIRISCI